MPSALFLLRSSAPLLNQGHSAVSFRIGFTSFASPAMLEHEIDLNYYSSTFWVSGYETHNVNTKQERKKCPMQAQETSILPCVKRVEQWTSDAMFKCVLADDKRYKNQCAKTSMRTMKHVHMLV
jgi:hypothetical protein